RHLLTHTSGLDPARADFQREAIREHARSAHLLDPPGTRFQYNNDAVDFLAAVVERASGVPLDRLRETRIFAPLDVQGANRMKDREGTPRGAGELLIRPVDLAKLGQLMLDGGEWHGQRILPRAWVEASVSAGQPYTEDCGLLWWREGSFALVLAEPLLDAWREQGGGDAMLAAARPLLGQRFPSVEAYRAALREALGAPAFGQLEVALANGNHVPFQYRVADGPARGFSARGWLGQYLVVLPGARLVAVRMRAPEAADYPAQ